MDRWWINGVEGGQVSVDDRGFAYGDGLFETMAVRAGQVRFASRHFDRLGLGCRRLGLPEPPWGQIRADLRIALTGVEFGTAKLIVTAGPGPRGYQRTGSGTPTVVLGIASEQRPVGRPARVAWSRVTAPVSPAVAGVKTLNRIEQVLARGELAGTTFDEALLCDPGGAVIGGSMSNLFIVRGRRIVTPEVETSGVLGVMRAVVLDCAQAHGLETLQTRLRRPDVERADEIFVTNALWGLRPVAALGETALLRGPVTQALLGHLLTGGVEECADYLG